MTWIRVEDTFPEHPKLAALPSDSVRWFHMRAICYAGRFNTDGEITPAMFRHLGGKPAFAAALVEAGLWDTTSGGWEIHDFLEYNPSKEEAATKRQNRAEAGRLGGQRSGETRRSKTQANGEANASRLLEAKSNPVPSRPVPSPTPSEAIASSGVGVASPPGDQTPLPLAVTEVRDAVLAALPLRWQRDPLTWDEAEQFGRDFAGKQREAGAAIEEFRRSESGLPFPQKLRKYMPGGSRNGSRGSSNAGANPSPRRQQLIDAGIVER